jgi:hypothetical protein
LETIASTRDSRLKSNKSKADAFVRLWRKGGIVKRVIPLLLFGLTAPILAGCATRSSPTAEAKEAVATVPPTTTTTQPPTTTTTIPCPRGTVSSTINLGADPSGDAFGYTAKGIVTNNRNDPIYGIHVSFSVTFPDGALDTSPVADVRGVVPPGASQAWGPSEQEGESGGPSSANVYHITYFDLGCRG